MNNLDKLDNVRNQYSYEIPSAQQDVVREKNNSPLLKVVSIILIVILIVSLILTTIYALLHPIDKIMFKFLLYRNCTIEVVASTWDKQEKKELYIDGNLIMFGEDYYEVDGDTVYTYVKTGKYTWQRIPVYDEEEVSLELGNKLFDKSNWKRVKGSLYTWRLKNSVAKTIDEISSITIGMDGGKIAIMGYSYGAKISLRYTKFGRTKIEPPWEESGMSVDRVN